MNNILFVIEGKEKKKIKQVESQLKEISKDIKFTSITSDEHQVYYKQFKDCDESIEFVCLLNEDMIIQPNILDIYKEYSREEPKTIYLPLVILSNKKDTGVLNNCLWSTNLAADVGFLDNALALRQMDTTLYGALVPIKCFLNPNYYKSDLKYYQHFYFLNKYADDGDNLILGIPKVLYTTSIDLSFEGIDNDVKVKNFKLAREINIESTLTIA